MADRLRRLHYPQGNAAFQLTALAMARASSSAPEALLDAARDLESAADLAKAAAEKMRRDHAAEDPRILHLFPDLVARPSRAG